MRTEIPAEFDEVKKKLNEGYDVTIGGDPVTVDADSRRFLQWRGKELHRDFDWRLVADRTAVCTKEDEPVRGKVGHERGTTSPYAWISVKVPSDRIAELSCQVVEIKVVDG